MAIDSEGIREIIATDKTSEKPQLHQQGGKQAKHPRVSMDLQLFHRRKTMLITFHSGRLNPTTLEQMAQDFSCTCKALLKDWSNREIWEPFIWEAQQATNDGLEIVKQLQLAKEEALYLMKTCKAPNARVGAIARYIEAIKTEIELKQKSRTAAEGKNGAYCKSGCQCQPKKRHLSHARKIRAACQNRNCGRYSKRRLCSVPG